MLAACFFQVTGPLLLVLLLSRFSLILHRFCLLLFYSQRLLFQFGLVCLVLNSLLFRQVNEAVLIVDVFHLWVHPEIIQRNIFLLQLFEYHPESVQYRQHGIELGIKQLHEFCLFQIIILCGCHRLCNALFSLETIALLLVDAKPHENPSDIWPPSFRLLKLYFDTLDEPRRLKMLVLSEIGFHAGDITRNVRFFHLQVLADNSSSCIIELVVDHWELGALGLQE